MGFFWGGYFYMSKHIFISLLIEKKIINISTWLERDGYFNAVPLPSVSSIANKKLIAQFCLISLYINDLSSLLSFFSLFFDDLEFSIPYFWKYYY